MMKSTQLAHGEYDKYIVTYLKHKKNLHWTSPLAAMREVLFSTSFRLRTCSWVIVLSGSEQF